MRATRKRHAGRNDLVNRRVSGVELAREISNARSQSAAARILFPFVFTFCLRLPKSWVFKTISWLTLDACARCGRLINLACRDGLPPRAETGQRFETESGSAVSRFLMTVLR